MLKTYLFGFIIGVQTIVGIHTNGWFENESIAPTSNIETEAVSRPVAQSVISANTSSNKEDQLNYSRRLREMGITLHPGRSFAADSDDDPKNINRCASLVYKTLKAVPKDTAKKVKNLTLYFNSSGRRGLGGGSTIILRCQNVSDAELVSVLVHELGHIKDTGVFEGNFWAGESEFKDGNNPIYKDDPSLEFYRLSFSSETTLLKSATKQDFVSGYAMTDAFEDFAETYNYYLLHGNSFRELAKRNHVLKKKYDFMKEKVFNGTEFSYDYEEKNINNRKRNYDSTVIGYDLQKFLAI